jgi:hypothetical protein
MDSGHRQHLEQRHAASEWRRRSSPGRRMITSFALAGSELKGWTLLRTRRGERTTPPVIRTLWHRGDPAAELLSIDTWECASIAAADDQLLEVLANVQSDAVERHAGIGDVGFALGHTMRLFARLNVVVLIRNAGPRTVDVQPIARVIDELLVRLSGPPSASRRR